MSILCGCKLLKIKNNGIFVKVYSKKNDSIPKGKYFCRK